MADTQPANNALVTRVFSYPIVNYVSDTVLSYYTYAKQNSYVKAGLETVETYSQPIRTKLEEYSHQPTIESLLHRVDQYGCKQLDKIEYGSKQLKQTYEVVKPKTLQSLENVANKIHGTPVEAVLLKTVGVVDSVVDSLLPPDPSEPAEISRIPTTPPPNILERTTPVINKLKTRVSKDSIKRLPSQTYYVSKDILFRGADTIPQLNYCVGVLTTAAHRVQDVSSTTQVVAKNGLQKGADFSKASVEYVYQSLNHMVAALTSLVVLIKKLDPTEAKATVEELTMMIQASKDNISQKFDGWEVTRLKDDISRILHKAGDLLSQQLAAGYTRAHSTDNVAIRKSVETIESIVLRIIDSFNNQSQQREQHAQPNGNHSID